MICIQPHISFAATLYKWVDEQGNIRYSDRLPPERKKNRFQTLDRDGRVLQTHEKPKPPEQIKAERAEKQRLEAEAKRKAEEEARIAAEKKHHDDVLLLTFTSEEEILEAKKQRLEVLDSVIRLLKRDITEEQARLKLLNRQANAQYTSQNKPIPGGMAQNIEYSMSKIDTTNESLNNKMKARQRVSQQYDDDLLRFRELKAQSQKDPATANQ